MTNLVYSLEPSRKWSLSRLNGALIINLNSVSSVDLDVTDMLVPILFGSLSSTEF